MDDITAVVLPRKDQKLRSGNGSGYGSGIAFPDDVPTPRHHQRMGMDGSEIRSRNMGLPEHDGGIDAGHLPMLPLNIQIRRAFQALRVGIGAADDQVSDAFRLSRRQQGYDAPVGVAA